MKSKQYGCVHLKSGHNVLGAFSVTKFAGLSALKIFICDDVGDPLYHEIVFCMDVERIEVFRREAFLRKLHVRRLPPVKSPKTRRVQADLSASELTYHDDDYKNIEPA